MKSGLKVCIPAATNQAQSRLNLYRDEKRTESLLSTCNQENRLKVSTYTAMKSGLKGANHVAPGDLAPIRVSTYTAMKSGLKARPKCT